MIPDKDDDIADEKPDIVKELYDRYKEWWEDISDAPDKYGHIKIH